MDENILIIEAEIVPDGLGGWMIRAKNLETDEEYYCKSIEEFSAFMTDSANTTRKDNFQVVWLESPKATPAMIADVRKKLFEYNEKIEKMGF